MSDIQNLNLDTSILLNYVYSKLPGNIESDRGSQRLLDSSSFCCVIGPTANDEFNAACDRRYDLYDDLLDWLEENPDEDIYEYDPTKRSIDTSSNDLDHTRFDVQHEWATDPRRKQLSDIRRCAQELENFRDRIPNTLLDRVYQKDDLPENDDLFDELRGLNLSHDRDIIVDAVEIHRVDGIDTLVAVDSDITDSEQVNAINEAIRNIESESLVLVLVAPEDVDNY